VWKSLTGKTKRDKHQSAKLPDDVRVYAVGDIHGRLDLLDELLSQMDAHLAANPIARSVDVFLGDYVDRGPASRDVIDRLIARRTMGSAVCLKGNHELLLRQFMEDPATLEEWGKYGGVATLISYGLAPPMKADSNGQVKLATEFIQQMPESHRHFLDTLELSFTCGDFFFVHAGVRPGIALRTQRAEDLLWIRDDFLLHEQPFGKVVVHGHTPVAQPEIRSNRINIDTGAYATGRLTCLVLERNTISFL
jgi:serine/threonine protein phosphatase 1